MRLRRTEDPSTEHLPDGFDDPDNDWYVPPVERPLYRRDRAGEAVMANDPLTRRRFLESRGYTLDQITGVRRTATGGTTSRGPAYVIPLDNDELERFGHHHAREVARETIDAADRRKREADAAEARRKVVQLCAICGESDDTVRLLRRVTHEVGTLGAGLGVRWTPQYDDVVNAHEACALTRWAEHKH